MAIAIPLPTPKWLVSLLASLLFGFGLVMGWLSADYTERTSWRIKVMKIKYFYYIFLHEKNEKNNFKEIISWKLFIEKDFEDS